MRLSQLKLPVLLLCSLAAAVPALADLPGPAFAEQPESDLLLANSYGGARSDPQALRLLVDQEAIGFDQQVSRTSGFAMDNWWAQTGAALVANNLIAAR